MILRSKLIEIESSEILQILTDVCFILRWRLFDYKEYELFDFLQMVFVHEAKNISLDKFPGESSLNERLETLTNNPIFEVCKELLRLRGSSSVEPYEDKKLMKFFKNYFKPPVSKKGAITHPIESEVEFRERLIRQKRKNGSL